MTSVHELKSWFDRGLEDETVTHMIIKWDSFDGPDGDYPLYVHKGEDVRKVAYENTERTMEVYAMHIPWDTQAREHRAFHWESEETSNTGLTISRAWDEEKDRVWYERLKNNEAD